MSRPPSIVECRATVEPADLARWKTFTVEQTSVHGATFRLDLTDCVPLAREREMRLVMLHRVRVGSHIELGCRVHVRSKRPDANGETALWESKVFVISSHDRSVHTDQSSGDKVNVARQLVFVGERYVLRMQLARRIDFGVGETACVIAYKTQPRWSELNLKSARPKLDLGGAIQARMVTVTRGNGAAAKSHSQLQLIDTNNGKSLWTVDLGAIELRYGVAEQHLLLSRERPQRIDSVLLGIGALTPERTMPLSFLSTGTTL